MSWDGTTPEECSGMEGLQGSHSVLGGRTPGESFSPGMEPVQGVLQSWDGTTQDSWDETTPGVSPGGTTPVLGWNDSL